MGGRQTELIRRQDYEPVGMVSAAPMSGNWFHAHFGASKEPLRLTAWLVPMLPDASAAGPVRRQSITALSDERRRHGDSLQ